MNIIPILERFDSLEKKIEKNMPTRYLTTKQVAELTGLSVSTIQRGIRDGKLKVHQGTGRNLFLLKEVERWVQSG